SQDLLDLKLMGLRLETKLTMIEGLVNRLNAQANKCAQNGRSGGGESETEVATSDTQERILRAQQAIIDISNRNTVELENLSQLVVTQTSKLANRSDAMLGLLKSSRQPDIAASTQGRRHPVDRHNV
ncbi:secreted protein, putative, partial [Ixodes scapularis]